VTCRKCTSGTPHPARTDRPTLGDSVTDAITDVELVRRFAGQPLSLDSAAHYRGRLERRLLINRCTACGLWQHPPYPICPKCWSTEVVATAVAGTGTIHLAVFLHQGPPAPGVDYAIPHPVITVELDEQPGLRFTSTVIDSGNDQITIGARVTLDWIERDDVPVPVFRLARTGAS
jgi:uncharacterized protein